MVAVVTVADTKSWWKNQLHKHSRGVAGIKKTIMLAV